MAGQDGATGPSTNDVPAGVTQRSARTWFLDATGSTAGSDVLLTFDLSDLGISGTAGAVASYHLLRRDPTPAAFGDPAEATTAKGTAMLAPFVSVGTATSISGDQITFSVPESTLTDGEYALGGSSGGALPVKLTAFTATPDGPAVHLRWTTATETNNAGFGVEVRQTSKVSETFEVSPWREIAFVAGAGTTAEAHTYAHTATGLPVGRYAFRLRQVDLDGTATYSAEVEATAGLDEPYVLSDARPNPARGETRLMLAVREAQDVRAELFDALGRRVATLHAGPVAALRTVPLVVDGGALAAGVYLVRVSGEGFAAVRRVVVAR